MQQFTEVDFYKCIIYWQKEVTRIVEKNVPVERGGQLAYPTDDGGKGRALKNIADLESALELLKNHNK